ncbi:hypothetical protein PVAP13_1NG424738 [Panicum virgatum]|uniref:Uncharacterized protein n=1 Tax=Panicum virgatum TaxID=38727 RepID=A0A8T0WV53_PANVG|nr:hypothetical protein PVAP13_1NG424738 [Panicum virgatum]
MAVPFLQSAAGGNMDDGVGGLRPANAVLPAQPRGSRRPTDRWGPPLPQPPPRGAPAPCRAPAPASSLPLGSHAPSGGATTGGRSGHGGGERAERHRHTTTRGPATVAAQGSLAGGSSAGQSGYSQLPSPISLPTSSPHGRRSSSLFLAGGGRCTGRAPNPACAAMAALGSSAGGLPPRRSGTREGFVPLHSAGGPARARAPPLPLHPGVGASPVDLAAVPSALLSLLPQRGRLPSVALLPPRRPLAGGLLGPGRGGPSRRRRGGLRGGGRAARLCSSGLLPPARLLAGSGGGASRGPPSASSSSSTRRELLPSASAAATVEQSLGCPTVVAAVEPGAAAATHPLVRARASQAGASSPGPACGTGPGLPRREVGAARRGGARGVAAGTGGRAWRRASMARAAGRAEGIHGGRRAGAGAGGWACRDEAGAGALLVGGWGRGGPHPPGAADGQGLHRDVGDVEWTGGGALR